MLYPLRKGKNGSKGESELFRAPSHTTGPGDKNGCSSVSECGVWFCRPRMPPPRAWAKAAGTAVASGSPRQARAAGPLHRAMGVTLPPQGTWRENTEPKRIIRKSLRSDGASLARF